MAAAALPLAKQGIGIITSIGSALLAQHTARLKGATNENQALDQVIPAWDADVQQVADAFNKGLAKQSECIAALQTIDAQVYQYLRSHVGPAGTAWSVPALGGSVNAEYHADCNKACTAGCCVYCNDLRPAIYGRNNNGQLLNLGLIAAIQAGSGTVKVEPVAAPPNSAYGNYSRPGYTIIVLKPKIAMSASVTGALNALVPLSSNGGQPQTSVGTSPMVQADQPGDFFGGGSLSAEAGSVQAFASGSLVGFALVVGVFVLAVLGISGLAKK